MRNLGHRSKIEEETYEKTRILNATLCEALRNADLVADFKYRAQECGWDDVLDCIAAAKASYDDKGTKNKVRAWSRNADTTADFLKSLAGIIPDEKGLSVLRQGLVIIFQVTPQALAPTVAMSAIANDRI